MHRDIRRLATTLALAWPILGIANYGVQYLIVLIDRSQPLVPVLWWGLVAWLTLSAVTPLLVRVIDRYRMKEHSWPRRLAAHAAFYLAFTAAQASLYLLIRVLSGSHVDLMRVVNVTATFIKANVLIYGVVAAAVATLKEQRMARLTALLRARLERQLAVFRLERAMVGLDPPSVLQALKDVESTVTTDTVTAEQKLIELGQELRDKIRSVGRRSSGALRIDDRLAEPPRPSSSYGVIAAAVFPLYIVAWFLLDVAHGQLIGRMNWKLSVDMVFAYGIAGAIWPLVAWANRRLGPPGTWVQGMTTASALSIAAGLVTEYVMVFFRAWGSGPAAGWVFFPAAIMTFGAINILQNERVGQARTSEHLRAQSVLRDLKDAQLLTLHRQLAPHFLFNALNSVLCLMESDRDASQVMLAKLRRLLEITFSQDQHELVTLRTDLNATNSYVDIERVRFRDALDLSIDVDPTLLDARVPSFLLQPLIENAVRHGSLASGERGAIEVSIRRTDLGMEIRVSNDTKVETGAYTEGIGLSNIRQRLEHLYGRAHRITLEPSSSRGFSVGIEIPIGRAAA